MADQVCGPSSRALGIVTEFTKVSSVSLSTPESMALAYLINGEFLSDSVRIDTLKGGLDAAIAAGDVQREKIKSLKKDNTNLIRALGSVIHECKGDKSELAKSVKKIARKILEGDAYPIDKCRKCKEGKIEFDSPDLLCKECWADWWVDGLDPETEEEREQLKKETLDNMDEES